jgi:hypothetical protein
MLSHSRRLISTCTLLWLALAGCSRQAPLTTPSTDQSAYVEAYPERLGELRGDFDAREKETRSSFAGISALPGRLGGADPKSVSEVVSHADATGRSSYYAEAAADREHVARFWDDEGGAVRRRVAASVTSSLTGAAEETEKPICSAEDANTIAGKAAASADRGVKQRLDERLAGSSEVLRFIEEREEQLGKRNLPVIQEHASLLAQASYVVNVRLETYRRELEALLEQSADVQKTLDREIAEHQTQLAQPGLSKTQKARVQARLDASTKARKALDEELPLATPAAEDMEKRTATLTEEYKTMLATLQDQLSKAPPAAATDPAPKDPSAPEEPSDRNKDITGSER